jgi:stress response protein YsnF
VLAAAIRSGAVTKSIPGRGNRMVEVPAMRQRVAYARHAQTRAASGIVPAWMPAGRKKYVKMDA